MSKSSIRDIALLAKEGKLGTSEEESSDAKTTTEVQESTQTSVHTAESSAETHATIQPQTTPPKVKKKKEPTLSKKAVQLNALFEQDNLRDYDTAGQVYIDGELWEVLQTLKSVMGLKIGKFVSRRIEEFLEDNQQAVAELIQNNKKKNKYLD